MYVCTCLRACIPVSYYDVCMHVHVCILVYACMHAYIHNDVRGFSLKTVLEIDICLISMFSIFFHGKITGDTSRRYVVLATNVWTYVCYTCTEEWKKVKQVYYQIICIC